MKATPLYAGCFGKLPCAGDFIAQNAGSNQAGAFQRWLLDGVTLSRERLEEDWASRFLMGGVLRYLWWTERPESVLIGAMIPGRDESGRRFPFSVFVETTLTEPDPVADLPGVFHEPLEAMAAVALESARGEGAQPIGSMGDLKHFMDGFWNQVSREGGRSPAPETTSLESLTVQDLENALGGAGAAGVVNRSAGNLLELMHRMSSRGAGPLDFALRFPLPAEGPMVEKSVSFWVSLARTTLGRGRALPNLFWTGGNAHRPGHLDLWFGTPDPVAVLFLIDPGLDADRVYPVGEGDAAQVHPESGAARERLLGRLRDSSIQLTEVVSALQGETS